MNPGTDHEALRIRHGTSGDVPTILRLIKGLAAYERLSHELEATSRRLRRDGFGTRPFFHTLICWRGREPIGLAVYFFAYSTFVMRPTLYIEDLFVLPDHRGHGAGKKLLIALAQIARRNGCGRMEWVVLDWNIPAIRFYRQLGAKLMKNWVHTRLTGDALDRLARNQVRRSSTTSSATSGNTTKRQGKQSIGTNQAAR